LKLLEADEHPREAVYQRVVWWTGSIPSKLVIDYLWMKPSKEMEKKAHQSRMRMGRVSADRSGLFDVESESGLLAVWLLEETVY
jgi:hypothetical protein